MGNFRKRMIWPSIFFDPHVQSLTLPGRVLFFAHILAADDEGRGDYGPEDWKSFAFPRDDDVDERMIEEDLLPVLWRVKARKGRPLVQPYEVDGLVYWYLPKWFDYQRIDRPSASKLPAPGDGRLLGGETDAGAGRRRPAKRNGKSPSPDQWDLLVAMAAERETTVAKAIAGAELGQVDDLLARDVAKVKAWLEAIPVRRQKDQAEDRVRESVSSISRAIQFGRMEEVASILDGVAGSDWTKVRVGIKSLCSSYSGTSKAEVFESIRRSR